MATTRPLRIGVIAPPWLPVPPVSYGGTELVIDVLCRGLRDLGHDVELFTLASSTCDVRTRWLFETADPDEMGSLVPELRHAAAAYDALAHCDIVHDHTIAGMFMAPLHPTLPVVVTNHGPFSEPFADLYRRASAWLPVVAISHDHARRASPAVPVSAVIHHGLDVDRYQVGSGDGGHLLCLGRMSPDKGVDIAIDVARRAGRELIIAAKMREPGEHRFYREVIEPRLGDGVSYVGEVDHATKVELLRGAVALLNPIRWPEPFGLVMVEALACGTPVVGTPCGAAPEIVEQGRVGWLATGADDLVRAVERIHRISRDDCRDHVERRFSAARMAHAHERLYRTLLAERRPQLLSATSMSRPRPRTSIAPSVATSATRWAPIGMPSTVSGLDAG